MLVEDRAAQLRREYFKLVDYELVDDKTAAELEKKIKALTPRKEWNNFTN